MKIKEGAYPQFKIKISGVQVVGEEKKKSDPTGASKKPGSILMGDAGIDFGKEWEEARSMVENEAGLSARATAHSPVPHPKRWESLLQAKVQGPVGWRTRGSGLSPSG